MGRGDKRTAKGKRFKGSFGNSRPANAESVDIAAKKAAAAAEKPAKKAAAPTAKKAPAKKKED
jgi:30S ribosomal protein S31